MNKKSPFSINDQIICKREREKEKENNKKNSIESWKPIKSDDIFRNNSNKKIISKFLNNYNDNSTKCILIRGPIGCGKSELINILLKENNYVIKSYDEEISTKEDFSKIKDSLVTKGIMEIFSGNSKNAIIIKNFDTNLKKQYQKELFSFLKDSNSYPLFLTSNDMKISSSRGIPNFVLELNFEIAHIKNLVDLGIKMVEEKGLFNYSINTINSIAKQCNGDIRHFENALLNGIGSKSTVDAVNTIGKNHINKTSLDLKDLNLDVKIKLNSLICSNIKFNKKILLTSLHTNSVVQFNYLKLVDNEEDNLKKLVKMNEWILTGLKMENYIRENQEWESSELYGIFGTIAPLTIPKKQFQKIDFPANTINKLEWKFSIFESFVYSLRYIVSPSEHKSFIIFLIKKYELNDNILRLLCKLTNVMPNIFIISNSNKNIYKEINLSKMRTILKKEI